MLIRTQFDFYARGNAFKSPPPPFLTRVCFLDLSKYIVIFQIYNSPLTRFEEVFVSLNIYPETINSDSEGDL